MTTRPPVPPLQPSALDDQLTGAAAVILLFLLFATTLATGLFALGQPLTPWSSRAILALALVGALIAAQARWRNPALWIVAGAALILPILSDVSLDLAWDSQEYHFDALYALVHGWNPIYGDYAHYIAPGATALPWPPHYPAGPWIFTALLKLAGLSFEASKIETPLLTLAVLFSAPPALRTLGLPRGPALALGVLAALSPVVAEQTFLRYTDGLVGALATLLLIFGLTWIAAPRRLHLAAMAATLALAVDAKFSALAVMGCVCLALLLAAWRLRSPRSALGLALGFGAATGLAILTLGFHPYVTNLAADGHPFYPVMGRGAIDLNTPFEPLHLRPYPLPVKLAQSLIARTSSVAGPAKWPFSVSADEITTSADPDPRLGGFGPLFSGAAVLLALTLGAMGVARLKSRPARGPPPEPAAAVALGMAAIIALVCAFTPVNWWMRYIPQLWLAPLLVLAAAFLRPGRWVRGLAWACVAVLALDIGLVSFGVARERMRQAGEVIAQINEAKTDEDGFCGAFGVAHARIQLMRDRGVRVIPLQQRLPLTCPDVDYIPESWDPYGEDGMFCPCDQVAHDPLGRWVPPPDQSREIYRQYKPPP